MSRPKEWGASFGPGERLNILQSEDAQSIVAMIYAERDYPGAYNSDQRLALTTVARMIERGGHHNYTGRRRHAVNTHCDLGVGCDEAGVCYAAAHGRPDMCPRDSDGSPKGRDAKRLDGEAATARPEGERPETGTSPDLLKGLVEALEPFVGLADHFTDAWSDDEIAAEACLWPTRFTFGVFRRLAKIATLLKAQQTGDAK